MKPKQYTVWTWSDHEGVIRYVGYGKFATQHPAETRWNRRFESDSELDLWLRSRISEPTRRTFGPHTVGESEALAFVVGLRNLNKDTLLKGRGPGSYSGGHPTKSVYRFWADDVGKSESWPSVRAAARSVGCDPSTVSRWCRDPANDRWGFVTDVIEPEA